MTADNLGQRRHVLFTILTAWAWRDTPAGPSPVVAGLRSLLGGWLGIGRIVVGMARQGYDLQLTRYGEEGWRATLYPARHRPHGNGRRPPRVRHPACKFARRNRYLTPFRPVRV